MKRIMVFAAFFVLLAAFVAPAQATLSEIGPIDPVKGFPAWYGDINGIRLDLMEAADPHGISDPVDPTNAFSQTIGFNAEGFWWSADSIMDTSAGKAILVQALEAAFAGEAAVDGEQSVFGRVRIRIDVPEPGIYTVTYPYGQRVFTVDVVDAGFEINVTEDIGCIVVAGGVTTCDPAKVGTGNPPLVSAGTFAIALSSGIGPFLTWDTFNKDPALNDPLLNDPITGRQYVGTVTTGPHLIKGSPTGNNFFRIEGPNIGGPGVNLIESKLFTVTGRIFNGVAPTALRTDGSFYSRPPTGGGIVYAFANSSPTSSLSLLGGPNLPAGPQAMAGDGTGSFFGLITLPDATVLPDSLNITATDPPNTPRTLASMLTDQVTITNAVFNPDTNILTVEAVSSDQQAPLPTLTAVGIGQLTAGVLAHNTSAPPPKVTVSSLKGGSDTKAVLIAAGTTPPPPPPTNTAPAITSVPGTTATVGVPFVYVIAATDPEGDVLTIAASPRPVGMTLTGNTLNWAPTAGQVGANQVTVTATDPGGLSATQPFSITVAAPPNAPPDITSNPGLAANVGSLYTYTVVIADAQGDTHAITLPVKPNGMAIAGNVVSWTPTSTQGGSQNVTVRVTDQGGLFKEQSFTIVVAPSVPEILSTTQVDYRNGTRTWVIRGNTTLGGSRITATLTRTGAQIGIGTASTLSKTWSIVSFASNSNTQARLGDTITLRSQNGAFLQVRVNILQ